MMFRTEIAPIDFKLKMSHRSKITMMGSCFTDNIGKRLISHGFSVKTNSFGIVFNPSSLLKQLTSDQLDPHHLIEHNDTVNSLDFHSKFNASTKDAFYSKLDKDRTEFQLNLKASDFLILTFGTGWVYRFNQTNKIIANCQKQNSRLFTKELLDLQLLINEYTLYFNTLFRSQPKLKVVLTVSPVRHLKDGLIENNRSKAILLLLCEALSKAFTEQIIYYPSYELIMDDLRDYRFFEKDLLHPNNMAIDYVYDHFQKCFFSDQTIELTSLIEKYNQLKNHQSVKSSDNDIKLQKQKLEDLEKKINSLKLP